MAQWVKASMDAVKKSSIEKTWKRVGVTMRDNGENNGNGDPIIDDIIDLVYLGLERLGIR